VKTLTFFWSLFKLVIGWFSSVFSGLDIADPSPDQLGAALSLFRETFIAVLYTMNRKMNLLGRLELEFGGINCEFGELRPPAPTS